MSHFKRMPINRYIIWFVSFITLQVVWAAPQLHCAEGVYDFGTVIRTEQLVHEFVLKNRGNEAVHIAKIKNCCGVQSNVEPMVIASGSNAVCRAVFTTRNRYGPQEKQILIGSNDRKKPYFELKIAGTLLRPIEYSPRFVRLENVAPDAKVKQIISASNLLDQAVTLDSVRSGIVGIEAKIIESNSNTWAVSLESVGPLPVGKLNGRIVLSFSTGKVNVPVIGTVKPIIQAMPKSIQLPAASDKELERFVMLRSDSKHPFELLSSEINNGQGAVVAKKMSGHCWRLRLDINPKNISSGSFLHIVTSEPLQKELRIPLEVR